MAQSSPQAAAAKLHIIAYGDANYSSQIGDPFYALLNPESYTVDYKMQLSDANQTQGPQTAEAVYVKTHPNIMNFDFLFDATGAIATDSGSGSQKVDIKKQIDDFMGKIFAVNADKHEPSFLKIVWGTIMFKGRCESVSINYKLFSQDGTALRAVLKCAFRASPPETADVSSPDLTHMRVVTTSDTLPLMCYNIYGSSSYYVQIAQINGITNFRKLQVGSKIFFPPLS